MAGGIDWFRWHHGSVTDPKFQLVAKKASVRLGDVMVVWAFILECASASAERGTFGEPDFDTLDFLLGVDPGAAERIFDAMLQRALIHATPRNESATLHATETVSYRVARWEARQPKRERAAGQAVGDATERPLPKSSTERSRERRARLAGDEAMQRHATPCNTSNDHATPRGEERREEQEPPPAAQVAPRRAKRSKPLEPAAIDRPDEIPEAVWSDWLVVRQAKRAGPVTVTAWAGLQREAGKAGIADTDAVRACCEFGWQGFNAGWYAERMAKRVPAAGATGETPWQRSQRERVAEMTGGLVSAKPRTEQPLEVVNAPRLVG